MNLYKRVMGRLERARKCRNPKFSSDMREYIQMSRGRTEFPLERRYIYPILGEEREEATATKDWQYFYQDLYMAKRVNRAKPARHYDIGSRVDGFITHLLSAECVDEVVMLDIRPFHLKLDRLSFIQTDATNLEGIEDNSLDSISSLHAIEHFGLGRYGDPIDPDGWKKALHAIQSKVHQGGMFYLGLPLGNPQRVCFNAHRLFAPSTVIRELPQMELQSFAYVHKDQLRKVSLGEMDRIDGQVCDDDCGLFIFRKK